jgi:hypothetical protein
MIRLMAEAEEQGDKREGITYYVGGAGPVGNVGSWDVPQGLAEGGYQGYVKVFAWQGMTHAGDQMNLSRNRSKAAELAAEIRAYHRKYPSRNINLIALSAGTGIATFALEYLSEEFEINRVIFLSCSLSSRYDLSRALRRIRGGLYVVYSPDDPILKDVVWYTGTVDRSSAEEGIAGLEGFHPPARGGVDTLRQYQKLHNVEYRPEFAEVGYTGLHTDPVKRDFIRAYIAPVLLGDDSTLLPRPRTADRTPRASSRPAQGGEAGARRARRAG